MLPKEGIAEAHARLGDAFFGQHKYRAAEAAYRQAIARKLDLAEVHYNLGLALTGQGKHVGAEAAFRRAIARKPDYVEAYLNLGGTLLGQQKYDAAEAAFRQATDRQPDSGPAWHYLGIALTQQARFDEAGASLQKGYDLLPAKHPLRERTPQLQQQCQRYEALDARLPALLRGTAQPKSAAEQIEFARLCLLKNLYAAAARFFRDAFAAEPKRAEVVERGTRFHAACAAAQAGCGQGKDADALDDQDRARWRRQALDWLRQDLTWWGQALDEGDAETNALARQWLRIWQTDSYLASVRARDALARLPEEERQPWQRLWSDVDALLRRASRPE
jgi:serine/threonine-protein kinase